MKKEINLCQRKETVVSHIIVTYVNMRNNGTWTKGIKKTDKFIALSTQIDSVQTQPESALAKEKQLQSTQAPGTKLLV